MHTAQSNKNIQFVIVRRCSTAGRAVRENNIVDGT